MHRSDGAFELVSSSTASEGGLDDEARGASLVAERDAGAVDAVGVRDGGGDVLD
jgi:hypothetical protein